MGKLIVFLCFALLAMTLVMGCSPPGAVCGSGVGDGTCCEPFECTELLNPWIRPRCIWPKWGSGKPWGPWGRWGPDKPGEEVEWPAKKESTE
ncbi:uncharacterized protein LOC114255738 [Monomorium pharaonis]|uniref:uncharacterized protein LOC114255738 n=1 Tax=Monomorium pharaonis TaxID=307658 RepID=UPI0017478686|nr:uncharacterized protein LOC114255738 [Monomorium pharaonis]